MILMVCIDDRGGMMFNHRRQSRDRVLCARMLEIAKGKGLHVTPYTQKIFDPQAPLCVEPRPWLTAGTGEYYFAEDGEIPMENVEKVYLYRWNRAYPGDRFFSFDPDAHGFTLAHSEDFAGYSHERITEEIYIKES